MPSPRRRRRRSALAAVSVVAALAGVSACGSSPGEEMAADPTTPVVGTLPRPLRISAATPDAGATSTDPPTTAGPPAAFRDAFDDPDGLLTNEYAHWNADHADAVPSPRWDVTSGSLFVRDGAAWTGAPDRGSPGPRSESATGSAVFRAINRAIAPARETVRLAMLPIAFVDGPQDQDWDGAHVLVRYQDEAELYAVSIVRRDGQVAIKRKLPGGPSNGGTYVTLAITPAEVSLGQWHDVTIVMDGEADTVTIELWIDGALVASAQDTGQEGRPIVEPGRVGIRADNLELAFDDLVVEETA